MTWQNRIIGYDTKPANQFTANPLNFRRHPVPQREALRGLLGEVGWVGAVLENVTTGNLIDGHARIEEALSKDEETPIPFLKVELTEAEEKLVLASFDPISAMATADKETLDLLLKDVATGSEAVEKMLADLAKENGLPTGEPKDAEPQIDKAEELRQKWGTETGQLWVIGSHRLLVGDATNKADVGRLCANVRPLLMVTDPPYGVNYDGGEINARKRAKLKGDENSDLYESAFALSPSNVAYAWFAGTEALAVYGAAIRNGFEPRALIIWNKLKAHYGAPSAHYKQRSEPCLYSVRKGNSAKWIGDMTEPTVWDIEQPHVNEFHLTQKPLECMARPIRNHSGDVYDPFVGSGTTLVAAENLNRKCYAIEISPAYVAVCLERMSTAFPHLKIEKVDQARAA